MLHCIASDITTGIEYALWPNDEGLTSEILNAQDGEGYTPLHRAVLAGSLDMMLWLVTRGAFVNAVNNQGETPLHLAARDSRRGMIEVLLNKGADSGIRNNAGLTASHVAGRSWCSRDIARCLLPALIEQLKRKQVKEQSEEQPRSVLVVDSPLLAASSLGVKVEVEEVEDLSFCLN